MGVAIGAPADRIRQSLFNHHPRHSFPPAGSATITLDPDKSLKSNQTYSSNSPHFVQQKPENPFGLQVYDLVQELEQLTSGQAERVMSVTLDRVLHIVTALNDSEERLLPETSRQVKALVAETIALADKHRQAVQAVSERMAGKLLPTLENLERLAVRQKENPHSLSDKTD